VTAAALVLLAVAAAAEAHAFLLSTSPADGSILTAPPTQVRLQFSEPVTPFGRGINVYSASGLKVAGIARASGRDLAAALDLPATPEAGTYVVEWRVTAQDTHPSRGTFSFSLGRPSAGAAAGASPAGSAGVSAPGVVLQTVSRWLHFAGFAAVFGVLVFQVVVASGWPSPRLRRAVGIGIGLLIVAAVLSVAAQAQSLGGLDAQSLADVTASPFGRVVALQLGAALLVWAALPVLMASRRRALVAVPLLALALAAVDGLAGHAGTGAAFWVTSLVTSVHVAAMAVWVGGLLALVLLVRERRGAAIDLARSFAPLALGALALAVVSGAVLAVIHLRAPADLLLAPYGLLLAAKIAVVGVTMIVAGLSRRRGRALPLEGAGMMLILLLASALGSLPPVR
jgi:copper transport protein